MGEPVRDDLEQPIADGMPQCVVDLLEPVEVEEQEPGPRSPERALGEHLVAALDQQLAIGQAGQLVMVSLVLPLHGHRGVEVERREGQREERDHDARACRHRDGNQRRGGQHDGVDEPLIGQALPDDRQHRRA